MRDFAADPSKDRKNQDEREQTAVSKPGPPPAIVDGGQDAKLSNQHERREQPVNQGVPGIKRGCPPHKQDNYRIDRPAIGRKTVNPAPFGSAVILDPRQQCSAFAQDPAQRGQGQAKQRQCEPARAKREQCHHDCRDDQGSRTGSSWRWRPPAPSSS